MRLPTNPSRSALMIGMPPAHARLVVEVRSGLAGRGEQLLAVGREQRLVRRDHRLAELQGGQNHLPRHRGASRQLGNEVNLRVVHDLAPIKRQITSAGFVPCGVHRRP